jgi:signal transduction histidine kinase
MRVLVTGKPEWVADVTTVTGDGPPEGHLRAMRAIGARSYVSVPLRSRRELLGVLTFATARGSRAYDEADLRAAEDLAHRTVIAIENADLVRALKESDRRKDEFLAVLSHELRNPLAPIRNAVQILHAKGPPAPELQWARDVIDRQVAQMARLVEDLLDVSRINQGKIELRREPVELASVIRDAVEASRPLVEKWGHDLSVTMPPEPVVLDADPTRLAQVLANLLNNAAKFTPQGGRISLTVEREGGDVVIRVRDNGVGIPADMLSHVFEMFRQVGPSVEGTQGGLGIGLTLVQRLVAIHGGTVEATSEGAGKGSEFIVRLPVSATAAEDAAGARGRRQPATSRPRRILVVDDNQDAADSLAILLDTMGHDVRTAYDGLSAVGTADVFQPSVVLLDIGLPKLNGYEVARRIRDQRGRDVTLIALTGWGQDDDRRRSKDAGFDHHLTKPVELGALYELLK